MKKQSVVIKKSKRSIIKLLFTPGNENQAIMRIDRRQESRRKEAA